MYRFAAVHDAVADGCARRQVPAGLRRLSLQGVQDAGDGLRMVLQQSAPRAPSGWPVQRTTNRVGRRRPVDATLRQQQLAFVLEKRLNFRLLEPALRTRMCIDTSRDTCSRAGRGLALARGADCCDAL